MNGVDYDAGAGSVVKGGFTLSVDAEEGDFDVREMDLDVWIVELRLGEVMSGGGSHLWRGG